jgi:3-mercaptopropionate dioxygenase
VWLPGQATPVHDHVTWCVVGVHEGYEHETRYRIFDDVLVEDGRSVSGPGSVAGLLPPGDIHRVMNAGSDTAISLHVYGTDIRAHATSIRRRYDLPVRTP